MDLLFDYLHGFVFSTQCSDGEIKPVLTDMRKPLTLVTQIAEMNSRQFSGNCFQE
jgi:hypothetical protein